MGEDLLDRRVIPTGSSHPHGQAAGEQAFERGFPPSRPFQLDLGPSRRHDPGHDLHEQFRRRIVLLGDEGVE